jgi:DNA-binding phage protein
MSRKPPPPHADDSDHFAIAYLNVMMEGADQEELVAALSRIARLRGGSKVVAARLLEKIELNGQSLYRALCLRGNPELKSAAALLRTLGLRLAVQALGPLARARPHSRGNGRASGGAVDRA